MTPRYIVIHNTANDASAENEIKYMQSNAKETSYHFAVDDKEIIQAVPLDRNAWHAGDGANGKGNRYGIAIEICYSKSGGTRFIEAVNRSAELVAYLLKKYGWGIDRVTKHQDYSGKYCPHRILDEYGWTNYINLVKTKMNASDKKEVKEMPRYNKVKDLPEWSKTDIKKIIEVSKMTGKGGTGDDKIVDFSEDMIRTMIIMKNYFDNSIQGATINLK